MRRHGSRWRGRREPPGHAGCGRVLGLSPKTLERYRVSGEGPAFQRFGARVRYLLADVEAWTMA